MHNLVMSGVASVELKNVSILNKYTYLIPSFWHSIYLLLVLPIWEKLGKHFEKPRWFSNRSYNMSWNRSTVQIPVWMQEAGNDFQKITELLLYLSFHFSHPSSKNWDISLIFSMSLHLAKEKHHLLSSSSISFFKVWVSSMKLRAWSSSTYNE